MRELNLCGEIAVWLSGITSAFMDRSNYPNVIVTKEAQIRLTPEV